MSANVDENDGLRRKNRGVELVSRLQCFFESKITEQVQSIFINRYLSLDTLFPYRICYHIRLGTAWNFVQKKPYLLNFHT